MRKNKKIAGVAGLAAIMVIGGTFAYFNQTMTVTNPFDTGKYDTNVVEKFNPEDGDNWEPGAEVNKDVTVENTGDYDVLVRVKFDESWVNKTTTTWTKTNTGMDTTTYQDNATDGLIADDKSVVTKILNEKNKDKWVYNEADGYWYYKSNLKSGENTGVFLDAVQLLEDADMGLYTVTNYYTNAETAPDKNNIGTDPATQWVVNTENVVPDGARHSMAVTKQDETKPGYGNANYTLTITAQTVQATDAALTTFGLDKTKDKDLLDECTWNLTQNKK